MTDGFNSDGFYNGTVLVGVLGEESKADNNGSKKINFQLISLALRRQCTDKGAMPGRCGQ